MESREILPIEDRLTHSQLLYNNIENGNKIHFYHFALEAAEKQIEQLQECNQMWIKAGGESTATIIKLQEENNRLKVLLKEAYGVGVERMYFLLDPKYNPFRPDFEEWLEKNNIIL